MNTLETHEMFVTRIVEDVFRTMLGLEMGACDGPVAHSADSITAAVQFVGAWNGALLLQCGLADALAFTRRLMPGTEAVAFGGDVRDSLGELANMIGGNLKATLPPGVRLSIPTVVEGSDFALHVCGGHDSATYAFSGPLGHLYVTLVWAVDAK